ncbi:MAG: histidine phosphatase family protein [SAR202 cluster bacterium]|nr:histidine phosphatase family protein [SAR202 cluster bacterium]
MGKWYLVRHGESEWNQEGRILGHADVGLSELGRRQVELLSTRMAGESIDAAYSSDLSRAVDTATGTLGERDVPLITDPDLREFSYGEWEGLTLQEVKEEDPVLFDARFTRGDNAFAAPGGETSEDILKRVQHFVKGVEERHSPDEDLLIVGHGGSMRALALCLLDLTDESMWKLRMSNASVSIISNHSRGRVLELWNDTHHLVGIDER